MVDGSDEILAISNPEALIGHPGEHLFVRGNGEGNTLTVRSVNVPRCGRRDPRGRYQGTAVSREAGTLDISMNLACVGGR